MYLKGLSSPTNGLEVQLQDLPSLDAWEIPPDQVIIEEQLGEGCFGEVYKGTVQGPITNPMLQSAFKNKLYQTVAIKLLKGQLSIGTYMIMLFYLKHK